jgi:hypothetical protein
VQADAMESKLVSLKAQVDALRAESQVLGATAAKAQRQQEEDERTIQVGQACDRGCDGCAGDRHTGRLYMNTAAGDSALVSLLLRQAVFEVKGCAPHLSLSEVLRS